MIADYPGWGEDLDALASRRLIETPVVIFAPGRSEQRRRTDRLNRGDPVSTSTKE